MQMWDIPRYRQKRNSHDFLEFGRIGVAGSFQKCLSVVTKTVTTGSSKNVPIWCYCELPFPEGSA